MMQSNSVDACVGKAKARWGYEQKWACSKVGVWVKMDSPQGRGVKFGAEQKTNPQTAGRLFAGSLSARLIYFLTVITTLS